MIIFYERMINELKKLLMALFIAIGLLLILYQTNIFSEGFSFFSNKSEVQINDEIEELHVDAGSIKTVIIPEENRQTIEVQYKGSGKASVKRRGAKILVKEEQHWFPIKFNRELKVYVPATFDRNISVQMTSGKLNFSGQVNQDLMQLESLTVQLNSGNLQLDHVFVEQLQLTGSSGRMNIDSITAKTGIVELSSGTVQVTNYRGALDAKLSSGKLDVDVAKLQAPIKIEATSGKASLTLPSDAHFTLKGRTGSGRIMSDFPLDSNQLESKKIDGTHGTGEHLIELKVSSGLIQLLN